jgi:hypothetical protein
LASMEASATHKDEEKCFKSLNFFPVFFFWHMISVGHTQCLENFMNGWNIRRT